MDAICHDEQPTGLPNSTAAAATGTPAPYGHACRSCAKAKCKCIYTQGGTVCERCCRLNKQCQPSIPVRKRNPRKTQPSRAAYLEEKLDDLVSLIRSQASRYADSNDATPPAASSAAAPPVTTTDSPSVSTPQSGHKPHGSVGGPSTAKTSPATDIPQSEYAYPVDQQTAKQRLSLFRQHMLSFCPFVRILPTTTAQELQDANPFLWLGILACTSSSVKQSFAIATKMKTILANKIVLSTERSLDLLQGLLVFLNWPQCQRQEKPFLMLVTNLGVTLTQDLGYTGVKGETVFAYSKKFWGSVRPQITNERTMNDRRAALAFYVWHVMVSDMLRMDNRIRWAPFLEESLRVLQQQPEWDGDLILVTQVRCALVTHQVTEAVVAISIADEKQIPMYLHRALLSQVDELRRTLPASICQEESIWLQLHATEANIHEIALAIDPAAAPAEAVKRLDVLQQCCKSLKSWFDAFEKIPPGRSVGFTFGIYVQLLTNIIILSRLTSPFLRDLSVPSAAWDPAEIRKEFDLLAMLNRLANKMDASAALLGIQEDDPGDESMWHKCSRMLRTITKSIQEENANCNAPRPTVGSSVALAPMSMSDQQQFNGAPGALDPFMTGCLGDDPWMVSSFFASWDSMNF